jgi:hypothetical protein
MLFTDLNEEDHIQRDPTLVETKTRSRAVQQTRDFTRHSGRKTETSLTLQPVIHPAKVSPTMIGPSTVNSTLAMA